MMIGIGMPGSNNVPTRKGGRYNEPVIESEKVWDSRQGEENI